MTLAETIYQHSLHLPEPAAREALAFIESLEKRYHAVPTAEGVGRATTRTVVISSVSVLLLDYLLTAVML